MSMHVVDEDCVKPCVKQPVHTRNCSNECTAHKHPHVLFMSKSDSKKTGDAGKELSK